MTKFRIRNLRLREISSVDQPAQVGAVSVLIKSDGSGDVDIRKNAAAVADGAQPAFGVGDFEDAMLRRADELARDQRITPELALLKGLSTDRTIMDLAHATEVARVAAYGAHVRKRFAAA